MRRTLTLPETTSVAVGLALFAAFLFGVSGAIAADAFSEVSPARVAQARALVATVVILPIAWRRRRLGTGGRLPALALFGLALATVNVTYYWAVDRLGVGPGITIQFTAPIMVLVWMRLVQHRPVSRIVWAAAVASLVGIALIARAWDPAALDLIGVAAGFAAAVSFATYLVVGEHLGRDVAPLTAMTYALVVASVLWLAVLPVWTFPTPLSTKVWWELAWLGIGATLIPFLAEVAALRRAPSGLIGLIATAEPAVAAAAAWILLSQTMDGLQIAGGVLVVAAVAAVQVATPVAEIEVPLDAGR
jgi:drug/metabolite transporter (DMT)-like permease